MSREGPSKSPFSNERLSDKGIINDQRIIDGNLMDGQGPLNVRAYKLMKLQRLGLVDKKFDFPKLTNEPAAFNLVEHAALTSAYEKTRGKGFMLRHVRGNDPRLHEVWYEGDPAVCWDMFKAPVWKGRINKEVGTHEETAKIRNGETLVVMRPDGTIAHLDGTVIERANEATSTGKGASTNKGGLHDPAVQKALAKQHGNDIEAAKNRQYPAWSN